MNGLRLDHVVIKVDDLARAMADYEALGFVVTPGGEHPAWGSRNALIPFADDSYLELISYGQDKMQEPRMDRLAALASEGLSQMACRVMSWAAVSEGLVDFALVPNAPERMIRDLQTRGLDLEGPLPGGRVRPDGQAVKWLMGVPDGLDLPFLCGDVTPRSLRVPTGAARVHPNGVQGIAEIAVAVHDLDHSAARYAKLLDVDPDAPDAQSVVFGCGNCRIVLTDVQWDDDLLEHVAARGESPYRLAVHGLRDMDFDVNRTHGVWFEMVFDPI